MLPLSDVRHHRKPPTYQHKDFHLPLSLECLASAPAPLADFSSKSHKGWPETHHIWHNDLQMISLFQSARYSDRLLLQFCKGYQEMMFSSRVSRSLSNISANSFFVQKKTFSEKQVIQGLQENVFMISMFNFCQSNDSRVILEYMKDLVVFFHLKCHGLFAPWFITVRQHFLCCARLKS